MPAPPPPSLSLPLARQPALLSSPPVSLAKSANQQTSAIAPIVPRRPVIVLPHLLLPNARNSNSENRLPLTHRAQTLRRWIKTNRTTNNNNNESASNKSRRPAVLVRLSPLVPKRILCILNESKFKVTNICIESSNRELTNSKVKKRP